MFSAGRIVTTGFWWADNWQGEKLPLIRIIGLDVFPVIFNAVLNQYSD